MRKKSSITHDSIESTFDGSDIFLDVDQATVAHSRRDAAVSRSGDEKPNIVADTLEHAGATDAHGQDAPFSASSNPVNQTVTSTGASFADQWYLNNIGQAGGTPGMDLNVVEVWDDYTGKGVTIGIFDSGIQGNHPELDQNYRGIYQTIYFPNGIGVRDTGYPDTPQDNHGTAVAGIIAAENNDDGGVVGVAYDATFYSVDIWDDLPGGGVALHYLENMHRMKEYDVVNHSWQNGYRLDYANQRSTASLNSTFYQDIQAAADQGRDGLGTIMVVAAANQRQNANPADVNFSNFLNNRYSVTVAAVDNHGLVTKYSNPGAAVLISGFSDPGAPFIPAEAITTTDRTGAAGYNTSGDYVSDYGGTSAAAPQVSGVVALMLEANPDLGWRDVQDILAYSARQVITPQNPKLPPTPEIDHWEWNGAANWNGGGLHFSNDYGFGVVDAHAAVRLAETWTRQSTSANEVSLIEAINVGAGASSPRYILPDGSRQGRTFTFTVGQNIEVERAELYLDLRHRRIGDVEVELISPDGTHSMILDNRGGNWDFNQFVFTSNEFRGELSAGRWTLIVRDTVANNTGSVGEAILRLYGDSDIRNDVYVYNDEFAAATSNSDHGFRPIDSDGGIDTINAAAVTSDSIIDLEGGRWRIAGVEGGGGWGVGPGQDPRFYMIENIVGGDGSDELGGNELDNQLQGGRGADRLEGRAGNDTLHGGAGGDNLNGGFHSRAEARGFDGDDIVYGDAGNDVITVLWGNDEVHGGDGIDTLAFTEVTANLTLDLATGSTTYFESGSYQNPNGLAGSAWAGWYIVTWDGIENVVGGTGNDAITGDALANMISGAAGDDAIDGGADSDTAIFTGNRADYSISGGRADFTVADGVVLRDGTDSVRNVEFLQFADGTFAVASLIFDPPPGQTFDGTAYWGGSIQGTAGVDTVSYATANYSIYVDLLRDGGYAEGLGGPGAATHLSSIENITGSSTLLNYLHGNQEDNILIGGDHFDWLVGRGGNNTLDGRGWINMADYYETNAPVTIDLTLGQAFHSTGIDTLINIQQFRATNSADVFIGDGQDNYFHGMNGNDTVAGNGGKDWLDGSGGNDVLDGGEGDDRLIGGPDDDWLTGGSGADLFVYNDGYPSADRILDFNAAEGDRIDLSALDSVNSYSDLTVTSDGAGNARLAYGQSSIVLVGIAPTDVNGEWLLI